MCRDKGIRVFEVVWVVRVERCLCMFLSFCAHLQLCMFVAFAFFPVCTLVCVCVCVCVGLTAQGLVLMLKLVIKN